MFDIKRLALLKHGSVRPNNIVEAALLSKWGGGASYEKTVGPSAILSVTDAKRKPALSLIAGMEPIQEGSGDPSPDNVRPIRGRTGLTLTRTGVNWFDTAETEWSQEKRMKDDDGNVVVSSYSHYTTNYVPVKPNTEYIFSGTLVVSAIAHRLYFYDGDKNWISRSSAYYSNATTFTTPSECCFMQVQVADSITDTSDWQLELGSTASDFAPYSGATYPVTFPAVGKNLFDVSQYYNLPTDYEYADGPYRCKSIQLKPNTEYAVSQNAGTADNDNVLLINIDPHINAAGYLDCRKTTDSKTFTTDSTGKLYIGVIAYSTVQAFNDRLALCKIQIEQGSSATAFEPYTNTVYGGTVDPVSGVLTVTHEMFTSTTDDVISGLVRNNNGWAFSINSASAIYKSGDTLSNINTVVSYYSQTKSGFCKAITNTYKPVFYLNDSDTGLNASSTSEDVKTAYDAFVTANGPYAVYPLKTPQTFQLTPQQIQMLKGANNLWNDAGDSTVTYVGTEPGE